MSDVTALASPERQRCISSTEMASRSYVLRAAEARQSSQPIDLGNNDIRLDTPADSDQRKGSEDGKRQRNPKAEESRTTQAECVESFR